MLYIILSFILSLPVMASNSMPADIFRQAQNEYCYKLNMGMRVKPAHDALMAHPWRSGFAWQHPPPSQRRDPSQGGKGGIPTRIMPAMSPQPA